MLNQTPPVVKNLLIINALFLLGQWALQSQGLNLSTYMGMHHWSSDKFMPHQLITHMFMHANITHLFFNMFALWMFGRILEPHWGSKKFLIYYLITGVGAALIHTFYTGFHLSSMTEYANLFYESNSPEQFDVFIRKYIPDVNLLANGKEVNILSEFKNISSDWHDNPSEEIREIAYNSSQMFIKFNRDIDMVGASGAVYGILLAFGMTFPNVMLFLLFPPIPIKAKWMVIAYGALELWLGISNNPGDNVAHFAHLGGMLFGIILILYWKKKNPNPPTYFH